MSPADLKNGRTNRESNRRTLIQSGAAERLALSPWQKWTSCAAIAAPILFFVVFTVDGLLRPGYSAIRDPVSNLGVGIRPWLLNGPMIGLGVLLVVCALSFVRGPWRATLGPAWSWICGALLCAPGVGYAVAAVYPLSSPIHWEIG